MLLTNSKVSDKLLIKKTDDILMEAPKNDLNDDERIKIAVEWQPPTRELCVESVCIVLKHFKKVNGQNGKFSKKLK
jgi:ribosome biogenesis protein ERB1